MAQAKYLLTPHCLEPDEVWSKRIPLPLRHNLEKLGKKEKLSFSNPSRKEDKQPFVTLCPHLLIQDTNPQFTTERLLPFHLLDKCGQNFGNLSDLPPKSYSQDNTDLRNRYKYVTDDVTMFAFLNLRYLKVNQGHKSSLSYEHINHHHLTLITPNLDF